MVKRVITLLLFVSMALIIPASVSAKVLTVKVSPKKIHQGDVFLVTVRGSNFRTAFRFVCKTGAYFQRMRRRALLRCRSSRYHNKARQADCAYQRREKEKECAILCKKGAFP